MPAAAAMALTLAANRGAVLAGLKPPNSVDVGFSQIRSGVLRPGQCRLPGASVRVDARSQLSSAGVDSD